MIASEEIFEDRKKAYYEQQRLLLARLMSERGGLLTKDATEKENECKTVNFCKELATLEYKFIDVVRDEWGLEPDDESATFGNDMDTRWEHFIMNHLVFDEDGNPTILYTDKDGNFRLIPGKIPQLPELPFILKNFDKIVIEDSERASLELMPSATILGIEGVCTDKYAEFNVEPTHKDFFITQTMILAAELLDIIGKHKTYLKEATQNELFKVIEDKYKEIF